MPEVRQLEKSPRGDDRRGIGARISGLFHSGPPLAEVIQNIREEQEHERQDAEYKRRLVAHDNEKTKPVRERMLGELNDSKLDFSRSFTASIRQESHTTDVPGTRARDWFTHMDAIFDVRDGSFTFTYGSYRLEEASSIGGRTRRVANADRWHSFGLTVDNSTGEAVVRDVLAPQEDGQLSPYASLKAYETAQGLAHEVNMASHGIGPLGVGDGFTVNYSEGPAPEAPSPDRSLARFA